MLLGEVEKSGPLYVVADAAWTFIPPTIAAIISSARGKKPKRNLTDLNMLPGGSLRLIWLEIFRIRRVNLSFMRVSAVNSTHTSDLAEIMGFLVFLQDYSAFFHQLITVIFMILAIWWRSECGGPVTFSDGFGLFHTLSMIEERW